MDATTVIRTPVVTEKATHGSNDLNRYSFEVDRRATKTDIKRAVEELYKVRVIGVNTMVRKAAARRYRYGVVAGAITKRAIVRIHKDDKIELL
jgi:large subunit ribosomal protein L23